MVQKVRQIMYSLNLFNLKVMYSFHIKQMCRNIHPIPSKCQPVFLAAILIIGCCNLLHWGKYQTIDMNSIGSREGLFWSEITHPRQIKG